MEDINKESVNKIMSMSKSQEIRFHIAFFLILIGIFCALTDSYLVLIVEGYTGNLGMVALYVGLFCNLLGLILMHGLRADLKKKKIMTFRKTSLFSCLLGYLFILIWISPLIMVLEAFIGFAIYGFKGLN